MLIQVNTTSGTLAMHSSASHPLVDLDVIQCEIQANMQALAWLFPAITDSMLQTPTTTMKVCSWRLTKAHRLPMKLANHSETCLDSCCCHHNQLGATLPPHLFISANGHPVKTDSLPRNPPSFYSYGALMHNIIQKLINLTNHISWLTEQMTLLTNQLALIHDHLFP